VTTVIGPATADDDLILAGDGPTALERVGRIPVLGRGPRFRVSRRMIGENSVWRTLHTNFVNQFVLHQRRLGPNVSVASSTSRMREPSNSQCSTGTGFFSG